MDDAHTNLLRVATLAPTHRRLLVGTPASRTFLARSLARAISLSLSHPRRSSHGVAQTTRDAGPRAHNSPNLFPLPLPLSGRRSPARRDSLLAPTQRCQIGCSLAYLHFVIENQYQPAFNSRITFLLRNPACAHHH